METELQQAERVAREFLDSPWALFRTRLLARVFRAQQARLAEVERERDAWKDGKFAAVRRAEAAEWKATEAARESQKAWVAGVRWMCEKFAEAPEVVRAALTPDKGDIVFYCGERIENIAATLYPAPTEREGARTDVPLSINLNNTVEVTLTDAGIKARQKHWEGYTIKPEFARVWRTQLWWLMSELGNATFLGGPNLIENNEVRVIANCPTPPQAAPEPRIAKPSAQVAVGHKMVQRWESDGFGRTWYRVVQKDYPNRDYGDFRAVLHALMSNPPMPTADEYAALLRLAGVPVPEEGVDDERRGKKLSKY